MRIISGKLKGKRVTAPSNLPVRPTTDFAKEALFNILNNNWYFEEINVLDLFSGIGSISLEFASRGTKSIISVDHFHGCIKFLEDISKQLQLDENISTTKSDVLKFLDNKSHNQFDLIFADPPYNFTKEKYLEIVNKIFTNQWLNKDGGNLIIEHSLTISFEEHPNFIQHKKYGNVHFSFFE